MRLYKTQTSSSIKFYWITATLIDLNVTYGYFQATTAELSSVIETMWSIKLKMLSGSLQKKFATPAIGERWKWRMKYKEIDWD